MTVVQTIEALHCACLVTTEICNELAERRLLGAFFGGLGHYADHPLDADSPVFTSRGFGVGVAVVG